MTTAELRIAASDLGFDALGVARAGRAPHADALVRWLAEGRHAGMQWMERTASLRMHPALVLPGVRSIVVLATNYLTDDLHDSSESDRGRIARYARGNDYHDYIAPRLQTLADLLSDAGGTQRSFVDSGPVLERDWAAACGISWHGKSTMGIHPRLGTWFFLSVILTTLELQTDAAITGRCGKCMRCIDACPTRAIVAPYRLDAGRCISYLTIENKGPIPLELRPALGAKIFGCDDCLDACPWNRFARASRDAAFLQRPDIAGMRLRDFLSLDEIAFKSLLHSSPVLRVKRRGFLRNVCVAIGNCGSLHDMPALQCAMNDPEPLVREHASWAIEQIEKRPLPSCAFTNPAVPQNPEIGRLHHCATQAAPGA